ncbi:hypothetical protein DV515_00019311, partial [Chloebia gouldiae]
MEERHVVEHLVAAVPAFQNPLPRVGVQHGNVGILIMEGNLGALGAGSVRVVGEVNLGAGQVRVGDGENAADQEGPAGIVGVGIGIFGVKIGIFGVKIGIFGDENWEFLGSKLGIFGMKIWNFWDEKWGKRGIDNDKKAANFRHHQSSPAALTTWKSNPLPRVVVQHGNVGMLIMEWNLGALGAGSVRVVGEVNLGAGQVRVGDGENAADQEGPAGIVGVGIGIFGGEARNRRRRKTEFPSPSELTGRADNMEERHVVEHLVAAVPAFQNPLPRVGVQHGNVGILIMEGNLGALGAGSVRVVGEVNLGAGQVRVGDGENAADQEGPAGIVGVGIGIFGVKIGIFGVKIGIFGDENWEFLGSKLGIFGMKIWNFWDEKWGKRGIDNDKKAANFRHHQSSPAALTTAPGGRCSSCPEPSPAGC